MRLFKSKPRKSVIEVIGLDNSILVVDDFYENYRDTNQDGHEYGHYGLHLETPILGIFDYLYIIGFGEELIIDKSKHFNLFLANKTQELTVDKIIEVTDYLANYFGKDSAGLKYWDELTDDFEDNFWIGRSWNIDKNGKTYKECDDGLSVISLDLDDDDGFQLSFIGYNTLL